VNVLRRLQAALSPGERRTIGIAFAIVLTALLAARGIPAGRRVAELKRARAEQAALALSRAREALAAHPVAQESLAARSSRLVALAPQLFGGTTAAETAAEAVSFIAGAATVRQVRITRQDVSADSTVVPFTRVRLRLEAESDVAGIMGWLASLEEGDKLIALERLTISALEPGAPREQQERLRVDVQMVAWGASGRGQGVQP